MVTRKSYIYSLHSIRIHLRYDLFGEEAYLGACDGNLLKTEVALKAGARDAPGRRKERTRKKEEQREKLLGGTARGKREEDKGTPPLPLHILYPLYGL